MKTLITAVALSVGVATSALAGTPVTMVAPDPVVVAPVVVPEWGGFYAGGSYAFFEAEQTFQGHIEDELMGVFAGYNYQNGSFVLGGELAYSFGSYDYSSFLGPIEGDVEIYDLKLRAGYAAGTALMYVVGGGTFAVIDNYGLIAEFQGFNYGAGMQVKVSNNAFVGIEYLVHDLEGSNTLADGETITAESIILRVGWQF